MTAQQNSANSHGCRRLYGIGHRDAQVVRQRGAVDRHSGAAEDDRVGAVEIAQVPADLAKAVEGGPAYPIPQEQMIHGAAVTETIVKSAAYGKMEKVI